jgi:predicted PolB exonuclease-like 3'-5' exonuclease
VDADHRLERVEVLRADVLGEAGIVRDFWTRLEGFDGTLVSFNGRGFDLPVLELQALRHGCAAPRYFGERDGLRARYGRHWDLCDWLTNGGATRLRGGLDLVSRLVGLPGKHEVSGADVQMLWEHGRWEEIHRYCAADVVQTYFVFLRLAHLRGKLDAAELARVEAGASEFRRQIAGEEGQ